MPRETGGLLGLLLLLPASLCKFAVLSVWPAKGRILNMATPKMTTDSSRKVPKYDLKGIGAQNIIDGIAKIRAYERQEQRQALRSATQNACPTLNCHDPPSCKTQAT